MTPRSIQKARQSSTRTGVAICILCSGTVWMVAWSIVRGLIHSGVL